MPEAKDEHRGTYPEYGSRHKDKAGVANHDVAAALFLRITINGRLLHPGTVLWSDFPAIMIAMDQMPSAAMERAATLTQEWSTQPDGRALAGLLVEGNCCLAKKFAVCRELCADTMVNWG